MTEAKSTPKTRANSLSVSGAHGQRVDLRIFRDDLGGVDHLHVDHHTLEEILEHARGVLGCFALPQGGQTSGRIVRDSVVSHAHVADIPLVQEVEDDILKGVLSEIDLGPADTPDVQDMPARDFERGRVSGRVKVLFRRGMSRHNPRKLLHEIYVCRQRATETLHALKASCARADR